MAQLIVRKLNDKVVARLKARAAANGRSAEEEHRIILQEQLLGSAQTHRKTFKEMLMGIPDVGDDQDFARRFEKPRKVRL